MNTMDFINDYKGIFESLLSTCLYLEEHYPCVLRVKHEKNGTGYKIYKVNNHHVMIMLDNENMPHGIRLLLNPKGNLDMCYYLSLCRKDIREHFNNETTIEFCSQELPF